MAENGEEAHATVYADRAADLADQAGDQKRLSAALTLGAVAYQKVGDYEAAGERAKRALHIDPKNSTALTVLISTKGRISPKGAAAAQAPAPNVAERVDAPLPRVEAARSGNGRSSFAAGGDGSAAGRTPPFVGGGTQKALKLVGEADRKWSLDKKAAMRLYEEAVLADAKSAAVRAARARARLENGDFAGALEDANASLEGGPSAEAAHMKAEALKGLGRQGDELIAAYKAAADMDPRYTPDYEAVVASFAKSDAAANPSPADLRSAGGAGGGEDKRKLWLLAIAAGFVLAVFAYFAIARRRE